MQDLLTLGTKADELTARKLGARLKPDSWSAAMYALIFAVVVTVLALNMANTEEKLMWQIVTILGLAAGGITFLLYWRVHKRWDKIRWSFLKMLRDHNIPWGAASDSDGRKPETLANDLRVTTWDIEDYVRNGNKLNGRGEVGIREVKSIAKWISAKEKEGDPHYTKWADERHSAQSSNELMCKMCGLEWPLDFPPPPY